MTTSSELASKILDATINSRPKQRVLEEDDYLNKLEAIVQRDFFPDIPELKKKLDYFEAASQNDAKRMEEIRKRLPTDFRDAFAATPANKQGSGAAQFETPLMGNPEADAARDVGDEQSESGTDSLPKLDAFLERTTSEDNASFASIMDEAEKRRIIKYGWAYPALAAAFREAERRLAPSETHKAIQFNCVRDARRVANAQPDAEGELALDDASPDVRAIKQLSGDTPARTPQRNNGANSNSDAEDDRRVRTIETWRTAASPMNAVMYTPAMSLNEMKQRPSIICVDNTRFDESAREAAAVEAHRRLVEEISATQAAGLAQIGRVGVDGVEQSPFGGATPRVGGWKIAYTPTPDPSALRSPLMTWGMVDGTPQRIGTGATVVGDSPSVHFKMPEMPVRDRLAFELCERVTSAHRGTKQRGLEQIRRSGSDALRRNDSPLRVGSGSSNTLLSPAARALTGRLVRQSTGMAAALQRTYSPATGAGINSSGSSTPRLYRPASGADRLVGYATTSERRATPRSASSRDSVATPLRTPLLNDSTRRVGSITDNLLDDFMKPSSTRSSTEPLAEPTPKRRKDYAL